MTQIKLRRDTSANFTSKNPVLGIGEPAYETDTKKLKIGDGTTAYTQLEYFSAGGSTDISATLPLKIVDGVISLEVDGQTIQIVDGKLHANLDDKQDKFKTQIPLSISSNSITTSVDPSITETAESWTGGGLNKSVNVDVSALNIDANSNWKIHLSGYMGNYSGSYGDTQTLSISTENNDIFRVWFGSQHFRLGANTITFNRIPAPGREFFYEIGYQKNGSAFIFDGTNLTVSDPLPISTMSAEIGQGTYTTLAGKGKLTQFSFVINSDQFRRIDKDISKSYFEADGIKYPITSVEGINTLSLSIGSGLSVVDGKLQANLDELSNEVNDLSGRVTAAEADISNKQDKLTFSAPLNQGIGGGNPYITTDGSLIKFNRASTAVPSKNGTIDNGTKVYAVTNGVIDYTHNLMRVDTPDILNNKYEFFFGLKGMTTSNPNDVINTGFILANTQTNGVVTPRYYISTPIHNGTREEIPQSSILYSIAQSSVSSDYVSYTLTQLTDGGGRDTVGQQQGFKGVRMYHNGSKYILQAFTNEDYANTPETARANGNWKKYTDYKSVDLSDVNSIYMPSNFSTETETSGIDASKTVLYKNDVLTDIHFASVEKGTEQVNLSIGSGLSVVDGKLTATGSASMPSNKYIDLTLGDSGAVYTAPANGWFTLAKIAGATNKYLQIGTEMLTDVVFPSSPGDWAVVYLPVKKGDRVSPIYNVIGPTQYFRFIYAEGEI